MTQHPKTDSNAAAEWSRGRGERWRDQLAPMEAMLKPVDEPLVRALALDAESLETPLRIADVACGGGGTSLAVLDAAPASSVVHGFDISPALVEVARTRIPAGEGGLSFHVADVSASPPEAPYDRLVSRFGTMFFDDEAAAFASLLRWLMPGGRFAFAVWGRPAENPWMMTVRDVVAQVVDVPKPDPRAPGPFRYGDPSVLVALLETAGFREVSSRELRVSLPLGGGLRAPEAAAFALSAFATFGELLAAAGDDATNRALAALTERYAAVERDGAVRMDASVHLVTGTRPRA